MAAVVMVGTRLNEAKKCKFTGKTKEFIIGKIFIIFESILMLNYH